MGDVNRFDSGDDARVTNSPVRHQYRELSQAEKDLMSELKSKGQELLDLIESCGPSREASLAKTKTEEAIMWAVKHVTR